MKKRRIVLASILKPVNETRMFEKMGTTLANTGDYEVFIIGAQETIKTVYPNINFLDHHSFSRLSLRRLIEPWTILRKLIKVKPEVVIICTHELLLIASLYKLISHAKIIYDVQENYFRNIWYTKAFPSVLRNVIASWVRFKEKLTAPFIDWFFLAERGYEKEFSFYKKRYTVIENKFRKPEQFKRQPQPDKIQLLFSGTIAESTGVFEAIELAKQLHAHEPRVTLTIMGYCAFVSTREKLRDKISELNFIFLMGGDQLVPHSEIIAAIAQANFGIIYYPASPHTENSIPTKLYEYMGCELPILLQNHKPWMELTSSYPAAISIDFENVNAAEILQKMKQTAFYAQKPTEVFWDSEAPK